MILALIEVCGIDSGLVVIHSMHQCMNLCWQM